MSEYIESELEKPESDQNGSKLKLWKKQLDKLELPSEGITSSQ